MTVKENTMHRWIKVMEIIITDITLALSRMNRLIYELSLAFRCKSIMAILPISS